MKDRREYMREYHRTRYGTDPQFREKRRAAQRKYDASPAGRAANRAWRQRPEVRFRRKLRKCGIPAEQIAAEVARFLEASNGPR